MRIRSIHPEFWRSEDVAALDWPTRLVFVGLWSYVDDNGVGRDVEKLIAAELFPLEDDPRETLATVSRALQSLCDGGQITRYTVEGKPLLHVTAWGKWQRIDRPGKSRYEPPTSTNAAPRESVATDSRESRDTPSTGEGEKGRRGEGEKGAPRKRAHRIPDDFTPTPDNIDWGMARGFTEAQLAEVTGTFLRYWQAESGTKASKLDWSKAWQNWVAREDPRKVQATVLRSVGGTREWTPQQLTELLGPAPSIPQPPRGLNERELWDWEQQARAKIRADRIAAAERKTGAA